MRNSKKSHHPFLMNIQLFGDPNPTPNPPQSDPNPNPGPIQPFKAFTDEASYTAHIKQAGEAQLKLLAQQLGFESVEAMQNAAKAKKEADDASKSELEREKAARAKAEAEKKSAMETANTRLINAEIKLLAAQAGFVDAADAVALVERSGIKIDDAGNVTGAKEAVEALAKAKPHLVGTGKPSGSPGSAGNGGKQAGGAGDGSDFAKSLAEKRAQETKGQVDGQKLYFK